MVINIFNYQNICKNKHFYFFQIFTMEAIAKHDFNATAEDELSFRKNQVLKVIDIILFSYIDVST